MYTKNSMRPQMNVSAQLVMASRLLQVPGTDLEEFIDQELTNNPALERASHNEHAQMRDRAPSCTTVQSSPERRSHGSSSHEDPLENIPERPSPVERLIEQAALGLKKADYELAVQLLYRLDARGLLPAPPEQLARELAVSEEAVDRVLRALHQMDPPGIGARDVRECFLIQCDHLEANGIDCRPVRRILTLAWSEFLNQQWNRVARKTQGTRKSVKEACEFMRLNLHPQPLALLDTFPGDTDRLHIPDLIISKDPHASPPIFSLEIPGEHEYELKISSIFQNLLDREPHGGQVLSTGERSWIRNQASRAWMVIGALRQRWATLRRIGEFVIEKQRDYLVYGPLQFKRISRSEAARELRLHESTISRAVRDKVLQLPNGHLTSLEQLFDPSMAAREAVRSILEDHGGALCDRKIAEILNARGVNISRRTITKYRHEIGLKPGRRQYTAL